ncbi:hypothetical protein HBB16_17830 [Pseudonocardia sp. MCCB 268]|nr:hypothetical protein [Pseudonocardia cytotoxica]
MDLDDRPGHPHGAARREQRRQVGTLLRTAGAQTPTARRGRGPARRRQLPARPVPRRCSGCPAALARPADPWPRPDDAPPSGSGRAAATELGWSGDDDEPMANSPRATRRKIGLAQALACDPDVLILDEGPGPGWTTTPPMRSPGCWPRAPARPSSPTTPGPRPGWRRSTGTARGTGRHHGRPESVPLPTAPPPGALMRIDMACAGPPGRCWKRVTPARAGRGAPHQAG